MQSNNQNQSEILPPSSAADIIRPYDILCGRSKNCFNNIGNRRFRITISMNLKKFDALPNRSERGKFISKLALTLKEDAGFRFIRISKKHGRVELSDEEIRAKIGHALRDLSKAQAEAAANMEKTTQEAQKVFASSPMATATSNSIRAMIPISKAEQLPPVPVLTAMKPAPKIVTPQVPQRSMIQDHATNNIRKEDYFLSHHHHYNDQDDISDISQDDHAMDQQQQHSYAQAQHHHHVPTTLSRAQEHAMKMPPLMMVPTTDVLEHHQQQQQHYKPAPRPYSYKTNDQDLGDDDYCLMPLFNETQGNDDDILDQAVPMDLFEVPQQHRPIAAANHTTFPLDHPNDILDDDDDLYEEFQSRCSLSN